MIHRSDTIRHTIGAHGRFAVSVVDGEAHIRAVDGAEVRATVRYEIDARDDGDAGRIHDAVRLVERRGDGFLELEESRAEGSWSDALARLVRGGWRRAGITLDVEVPRSADVRVRVVNGEARVEGTAGSLEVRSVSGDVSAESVSGALTLDTVSGDARVTGVAELALRGRTVSGDVSVSTPRLAASRVTTVSGDVELEGELGDGEHHIESASGDLRLAVVGGATVEVTGVAADVHSEVPHRVEGSMGHRRVTVGGGGPDVRFRTMSGSLLVAAPRTRTVAPAVAAPAPTPPAPPAPPASVTAARPTAEPPPAVSSAPGEDDRLALLRAVERGEIGVDEALRRLEDPTSA